MDDDLWADNRRSDGVTVREMQAAGAYEIARPDRPTLERCPVCASLMLTERQAKRVADTLIVAGAAPASDLLLQCRQDPRWASEELTRLRALLDEGRALLEAWAKRWRPEEKPAEEKP